MKIRSEEEIKERIEKWLLFASQQSGKGNLQMYLYAKDMIDELN